MICSHLLLTPSGITSQFASAFDNGTVHVWDVRRPLQTEFRFHAHNGLVMTLAWHPLRSGVIATGGRDRTMQRHV